MAAKRGLVVGVVVFLLLLLVWAVVVTVFLVRELREDDSPRKDEQEDVPLHFINREHPLKHHPGQCGEIPGADGGSEDLTIISGGLMFVTSGILAPYKGRMLLVDLESPTKSAVTVPIDGGNTFNADTFHPHGMTKWEDPNTGEVTLLVLSHPPQDEDKIEMFTFDRQTQRLTHVRSITDPQFGFMNDLVAVDKDKFYITYYYKSWATAGQEIAEKQTNGKILYYDGEKATVLETGFFLSNGINASPDLRYIYMAEVGTGVIWVFERNMQTNKLTKVQTKYTGTGIDNIEVDPATGDMWIGSHPSFHKIMYAVNNFETEDAISPSQVLRVKMANGTITDVIEVFLDDGKFITGSTAANYYKGKIYIGSVLWKFVWCEANCID